MEILSKQEAKGRGATHYFTGRHCKNGHLAPRLVSSSTCVDCNKVQGLKHRTKVGKEGRHKEYLRSRATTLKRQKARYEKNPEKFLARNKEWQKNNKEKQNSYKRNWAKKNRNKRNFATVQYRMRKARATPAWADLNTIREIYYNCPKGMHVDHIVPIKGENVCGLHVENNLQYLTKQENLEKGNKYESIPNDQT